MGVPEFIGGLIPRIRTWWIEWDTRRIERSIEETKRRIAAWETKR